MFRLPRDPSVTYVKRVIGLPGDRIQMVDGRLLINGQAVPLTPAGNGRWKMKMAVFQRVARYTEILPGGVSHPIFKMRWDGMLDNTPVFTVPPVISS